MICIGDHFANTHQLKRDSEVFIEKMKDSRKFTQQLTEKFVENDDTQAESDDKIDVELPWQSNHATNKKCDNKVSQKIKTFKSQVQKKISKKVQKVQKSSKKSPCEEENPKKKEPKEEIRKNTQKIVK